ncbi:MAG: carboxylesterase family protein, partial [Acidobacteriota bacterium]
MTAARSAPAEPIATTTYGRLRGRTEDGVHVFRGVPCGANTTGKNRFMPPQKPAAWQDVRDALTWGHVAPQPRTPELPWPTYDPDTRPTMIFDLQSGAQNNPHGDLLALLPHGT